jgi:predicted RNA-binding protein with PUA-like domain
MNYWLMKSEPDVFSIDHLFAKKVAGWDGVRNYQARNFLRGMRRGDRAFFYHSSTVPPGIAGIVRIVKEAYADPSQFNPRSEYYDPKSTRKAPRWDQVDVRFEAKFACLLTLDDIRKNPELQTMSLLRRSRLSVQPVTAREWAVVLRCVGVQS